MSSIQNLGKFLNFPTLHEGAGSSSEVIPALILTTTIPLWWTSPLSNPVNVWITLGSINNIIPDNIRNPIEIGSSGTYYVWIESTLDAYLDIVSATINWGLTVPSNLTEFPQIGEGAGTKYYYTLGAIIVNSDLTFSISSFGSGSITEVIYTSEFFCQSATETNPGGIYSRNKVALFR